MYAKNPKNDLLDAAPLSSPSDPQVPTLGAAIDKFGHKRMLVLSVSVIALGAIAFALSYAGRSQAAPSLPPPPAVSAAEVLTKEIAYWDEFPGRVVAIDSVEIRSRVSGYIDSVKFHEGDEVKRGDVLFVIDRRPFLAQLARAEAELTRAKTHAELAQGQADRAKKLLAARVISQEEHDERLAAAAETGAAVKSAAAAAETARLDLEYTTVRSPIDGRAGQALITAGNLVNPNTSLLTTVVSLDRVYVYFESDEQSYLRYAAMGQSGERSSSQNAGHPVQVGLAGEQGFPHQGTLDFVDNHLDPATGTIRIRAVFDNKDRSFTPGLFARVKLLGSGQMQALVIDEKAVLTDQDRKYVYVVDSQNHAVRRDVKLGRKADDLRVVTEGLEAGDRVIVHGVQKVFMPNQPVTPHAVTMGEPPARS